jgi:hypothetical protein
MKYAAHFRRLAALERALPGPGATLTITGGLPPDYAPAKPQPPGGDLKTQHQIFAGAVHAQKAPDRGGGQNRQAGFLSRLRGIG